MSVLAAVAEGARGFARIFKGILGEDAYDKYRAHHEATGCELPPMTVKEFWRDKFDAQERNPEGRCC